MRALAERREQQARPPLLHLHRGRECVERAATHRLVEQPADLFACSRVELALQFLDEHRRTRRTQRAEREPKQVGRLLVVARPGAVASALRDPREARLELVHHRAQQRGAGRCRPLAFEPALPNRDTCEQFERRGRWHRQHAVRSANGAGADGDCRRVETFDAEHRGAGAGTDDVDDGVLGADLVEVHRLDRAAMCLRLDHRDPFEGREATTFHLGRQLGAPDDGDDLSESAVCVRGGRVRR